MDELFSCRNCIHNCGQSLSIGPGSSSASSTNPSSGTLIERRVSTFIARIFRTLSSMRYPLEPALNSLGSRCWSRSMPKNPSIKFDTAKKFPLGKRCLPADRPRALARYYKVRPPGGALYQRFRGVDATPCPNSWLAGAALHGSVRHLEKLGPSLVVGDLFRRWTFSPYLMPHTHVSRASCYSGSTIRRLGTLVVCSPFRTTRVRLARRS